MKFGNVQYRGKWVELPNVTTAERNTIASPRSGFEVFNTDTLQLEFFDGLVWKISAGGSGGEIGPTGYTGAQGVTGLAGYTGAQGLPGVTGPSASAGSYSTPVGDGVLSDIVITHGLGTRHVIVSLYMSTAPYGSVSVLWEATSTDTITLRFADPPAAASYIVYISGGVAAYSPGAQGPTGASGSQGITGTSGSAGPNRFQALPGTTSVESSVFVRIGACYLNAGSYAVQVLIDNCTTSMDWRIWIPDGTGEIASGTAANLTVSSDTFNTLVGSVIEYHAKGTGSVLSLMFDVS